MSDVLQVLPYSPQPLPHLILLLPSDPLLIDPMAYVQYPLSGGTAITSFGSHSIGSLSFGHPVMLISNIIEVQQLIILVTSIFSPAAVLIMVHHS